ncbi:tetratricopeptide repeat protein [Altibacter sp. HG106]|uniref:tetratricopeptide repeat protein n=1 Tax=Altibacter sp. HG106 TaxID=3023937 RepID=UPI002350B132|nr:tetratricopeptide repeat protein [Altibacter sp. HG106]MDC7994784.1 tetratricopeptide repeat protein [Altibacter sp. HG106]
MRNLLFVIVLCLSANLCAQNDMLAKNYFEQGQFEKAVRIYEKLYQNSPHRLNYLTDLVKTYQQLEEFEKAQAALEAKLSGPRVYPQLYVDLGYNYALQGNDSLAQSTYQRAISSIEEEPNYEYIVARSFEEYSLLEEAATVYERAMELQPDKNYNIQLANIYGEQGKLEAMFLKLMDLIQSNPQYQSRAQRTFSMYITEDPASEANTILRKTLLKASQENPSVFYNQMLSWLFIQQQEFKKALIQEKAIYKRSEGETTRLFDLAYIAKSAEAYEEAREVVDFILDNSVGERTLLQAKQLDLQLDLATVTETDYEAVEEKFQALFATYGNGAETHLLQIDYNHFLAFQTGKIEEAIANLKRTLEANMSPFQEARVKMELADILVFDERFNEALIYYTQIQKRVKNDVLAQEARFKVAKTSYYKGDFEWAQTQLDVLKKSASQLIANDAMQLSLMIRDNSLEDSTQTALKKFARADLLTLQNKNQAAIAAFENILTQHKGEKIEDEALLQQAHLYERIFQYDKAETNYQKIIAEYKEDILADDAYFFLAKLYQGPLNLPEQAKAMYEQLIYDFSDSIYFVEARKRFRLLRGDAL